MGNRYHLIWRFVTVASRCRRDRPHATVNGMQKPAPDTTYRLDTFRIGPMDNFGYLVVDQATGEAATVDPAWDASVIRERAAALGARISQVWLTHSHYDHVNALDEFRDLPISLSAEELAFWKRQFATGAMDCTTAPPEVPQLISDGDSLTLGTTSATWWLTPGHSPGSSCIVLSHDALVADTLFVYGCGRCDLDESDPVAMHASLNRLKRQIPAEVFIHPGHDYGVAASTTMAEQVAGNPFLMFDDAATFSQYRMVDHGQLRSQPFGPETAPYPG